MADPPQPTPSKSEALSSITGPSTEKPHDAAVEDDSDPDFDDLDDVLDQFSAATTAQSKSQSEPTPSSSGPGRPTTSDASALPPDIHIPEGPKPAESEDEFMARLTAEMSSVMTKMSTDPAASAANPEDIAKMGRELEEFTQKMEAEGIKPEDLLKAILGEETGTHVGEIAEHERERRESEAKSKSRSPEKSRSTPEESSSSKGKPSSFEDTIRKTMARMESSSAAASNATAEATKSEEDMLAEMLRALDSESAGSDGDLSKMFLGMMEQLTNRDMLYEPMKELNTKYPDWLEQNKSKLPKDEYERFTRQEAIVKEIVGKFEEKNYSDDDPKCREFVWEKMQAMQTEGAPPEDLVANPFPGMGGLPDLGGLGGGEGPEEGCPTQ
ncbi:Peroxisome chaperone and import receptor [Elasticomyces elasticus]|uniref:Peroxisome chaperone and import receptor n=1 Tax=Exophiala sideris TaxID=1016849 RepID=A0ABR0JD59_9EURO|nr:Peroxisome chaperone and import receptor [Elasticomyces elasticus]KAK5031897.1 Peroxisome chaperone and import receptor [Exophiala sideris]KAK5040826.1 Peroxisome chaperone and import receptor [Exophiala sideris]KAK5061839.1 Peroxisome chaperone and import receptor [Exophiala sideris]KAK5184539.1 Peroxisome chaperone and import receptor [Eurotiomycetes sp. CCFEE 6388]